MRIIRELDRGVFVLASIALLAPFCWIAFEGFKANADTWDQVWYRPFYLAALNSLKILAAVMVVVFPLGLLLGCVAGLYKFPLKYLGMLVLAVPLLFPGFLIAIGIQSLRAHMSYSNAIWVDGFRGCVWTGVLMSLPFTIIGTWLAVRKMAQAERDVMRIRGGIAKLLLMTCRRYAGTALGFSALGAFLYLSDFGVNQIMGFPGIAGDIQIAFTAKNNFSLAAAKALTLLLFISPFIWLASRGVIAALFPDVSAQAPRQGEAQDTGFWAGTLLGVVFFISCVVGPTLSITGLIRPLFRPGSERHLESAAEKFINSLEVTLQYGLTGGVVSVFLALVIVLGLKRRRKLVQLVAGVGLLLMTHPSAVVALGMVKLSASWPWADAILRSEWAVGLGLGLRLAPLCAVVFLVLLWVLPRSLQDVQRVTGMPVFHRKWKLDFPEVMAAAVVMTLVSMILTLADVGAMTLIQPPGSASYGSLLFATMDNSPEQVVSSMCVVYGVLPLAVGIILLLIGTGITICRQR